ncbi:MAG: 3-deoxy-D-manno-octulosonate 8-phosphate phosphatase [Sulfuricurvum sp. RIFOXYD2_FULL_44_160]|uniref:3-deoxy-D-manno-octulosonate 8-phosphate phosphatase KdsC n=1 Tax=Sulfuricurvum kujiense TaxID=148813 RepID=A0A2D3WFE8_9BACT|nr:MULTISPECIES: HAD-IIIA family hydrolase [Sulfuricurvum]OHD91173.1 MAG: 3-deoxy-D-manno-octulosonate 8-phosphate phosphatase [Sulfuricurvum sp. RIFOXYD2_FULL_44_160]OHD95959.1 MAG: 3-deoxy-D-manno-octulosonate 8-phosphate phosphatase [Sulfuricurvum sp. RIFOXYD12_FULL_44_77]DAB37467.1 MAG TPA: 3-deoxy-D-manno-octulosonate 8-phosphate phosphatase [Sulfuricurvum kujiense]
MIKLLILDVDGCMSDGKIIYTAEGLELKNFNVKDGFAIKAWVKMGHSVAIITGRDSSIVTHRAKELDIAHLYQGVKDKRAVAMALCTELGIEAHEVAVIGDDLNDYNLLQWSGQAFTPQDGSEYLKTFAEVLDRKGGDACVREMIEKVIRRNGEEEKFLAQWI